MKTPHRSPRAGLAALALLAAGPAWADGNVEVTVSTSGKLLITGDEGANSISVEERLLLDDFFVVTGNGGTTVNGLGDGTFGPVTGDIVIRMRHGGNTVSLQDVGAPAAVKISSGNGDDLIILNDVGAPGDVRVTTKKGADDVFMDSVTTGAELQIRAANGDDTFDIGGGGSVAAKTRIVMGTGTDFVGTSAQTYGGPVKIQLGGGEDELSSEFNDYDDEFEANGQGDDDTFESFMDTFSQPPVLKGFEFVVI